MVFLCNCVDSYSKHACERSGVLSILWNLKLNFPYVERAEQRKAKETKKALTPFGMVEKRKKKQKEEEQLVKDNDRVERNSVIPEYSAPLAQSGACMTVQGGKIGRLQSVII
jgi:hypothetical protein